MTSPFLPLLLERRQDGDLPVLASLVLCKEHDDDGMGATTR